MFRALRQCMASSATSRSRASSRSRDADERSYQSGSPIGCKSKEVNADDLASEVSTRAGSSRGADDTPSPHLSDYSPWAPTPPGSRDPASPLQNMFSEDGCVRQLEKARPQLKCDRQKKNPPAGGLSQEELDELCVTAPSENNRCKKLLAERQQRSSAKELPASTKQPTGALPAVAVENRQVAEKLAKIETAVQPSPPSSPKRLVRPTFSGDRKPSRPISRTRSHTW